MKLNNNKKFGIFANDKRSDVKDWHKKDQMLTNPIIEKMESWGDYPLYIIGLLAGVGYVAIVINELYKIGQ